MKTYSMIIFFFIFLPLFFSEKPRLGLVNQSRGFFMSSLGVYEPALSVKSIFILFLDKMVNTILSCESFAGRRWRREMYGLTFFAATPLAAETAAE